VFYIYDLSPTLPPVLYDVIYDSTINGSCKHWSVEPERAGY